MSTPPLVPLEALNIATQERYIAHDAEASMVARLVAHLRTPLYWNGYALILSSGATSGLGMIYWIVAAHSYSAEAVGLNSALIAAMMFLAGISQFNLTSALIRFIPGAGHHTGRLVLWAYVVSIVVAVIASLVFISGLDVWSPKLAAIGTSPLFVGSFVLAVALWCIQVLQDSVLTGLRRAAWVPASNIVYAVIKLVLLIALADVLPAYGVFVSWTLGLVVLGPMAYIIFTRLIPAHINASHERAERLLPMQVIRYVPADYLGALAWLAATTLLPILVTHHVGLAQNAYFYLAWGIAFALHDVGDNMGYSLVVEGANDPTSLRASSRHVLIHTSGIVLALAIAVFVLAPYLLLIFGPAYAAEGTTLLRLLALAAVPNTINALYVSIARVQRRTGAVVAVMGTLCVMVLGLSSVLLDWYGITGVGIAWLVSQTSIAAVLLLTKLRPFWMAETSGTRAGA